MKKFLVIVLFISFITLPSYVFATDQTNMLIVFDASGSMTTLFDGVSRISAAKTSIASLLSGLDSNIKVGLRALASTKQSTKELACKDTTLLQPFTNDVTSLGNQVNSIQAIGTYTPLAYSLEQTKNDFVVGQNNALILMTDGLENCGGNPVQVAADLCKSGVNVKVYVIGLAANTTTRTQLKSIASSGCGVYYDANDVASLTASFKAIQEVERPIDKTNTDSLLGKEITGGNGYETAVEITSGDYHLAHHQLGDQFDYFKIKVQNGQSIKLSLQSSENGVDYDKTSNSFIERKDHRGDIAYMSINNQRRASLGYLFPINASELKSTTILADYDGYIYLLVGPAGSGVMSKKSIFSVEVVNGATVPVVPTIPSVPASVPATSGSGVDDVTTNTNNPNTNVNNQTNKEQGTSGSLMVYLISGLLIFVIAVVVVMFILKKRQLGQKTVINQQVPIQTPKPVQNQSDQVPPNSPNINNV